MGSSNNLTRKKLFFVFGLVFFIHDLQTAKGAEQPIFDVTKFDAKGNGKPVYTEDGENANSFVKFSLVLSSFVNYC